jgi:hypothetical protein
MEWTMYEQIYIWLAAGREWRQGMHAGGGADTHVVDSIHQFPAGRHLMTTYDVDPAARATSGRSS